MGGSSNLHKAEEKVLLRTCSLHLKRRERVKMIIGQKGEVATKEPYGPLDQIPPVV